jgi:hypothetical protein
MRANKGSLRDHSTKDAGDRVVLLVYDRHDPENLTRIGAFAEWEVTLLRTS